jgi:hypothetical protein
VFVSPHAPAYAISGLASSTASRVSPGDLQCAWARTREVEGGHGGKRGRLRKRKSVRPGRKRAGVLASVEERAEDNRQKARTPYGIRDRNWNKSNGLGARAVREEVGL